MTENASKNVLQQELLSIVGKNGKLYSHFGKQSCSFLGKHNLIKWSRNYVFTQRNQKMYVHTNTCIQMFIAALFVIAEIWKHSRLVQ